MSKLAIHKIKSNLDKRCDGTIVPAYCIYFNKQKNEYVGKYQCVDKSGDIEHWNLVNYFVSYDAKGNEIKCDALDACIDWIVKENIIFSNM